jgi:hypothetical protein
MDKTITICDFKNYWDITDKEGYTLNCHVLVKKGNIDGSLIIRTKDDYSIIINDVISG